MHFPRNFLENGVFSRKFLENPKPYDKFLGYARFLGFLDAKKGPIFGFSRKFLGIPRKSIGKFLGILIFCNYSRKVSTFSRKYGISGEKSRVRRRDS